MASRVRRPSIHEEILERITSEGGNPFHNFYEALTFCAALGYVRERRETFEKSGEPIRWELFENNIDGADVLVSMLAGSATDEIEILGDEREDERMTIFEEYACGGLSVLKQALDSNPAKTTREVVLDLVLSQEEASHRSPDFGSIAEELAS